MEKVKISLGKSIKIRKICSMFLAFCLVIFLPASMVSAAGSGGSGGLVTLTVTVTGLPDNSGVHVYAEKEIDGVLTTFSDVTDSTGKAILSIPFGGTAKVYGEDKPGYIPPSVTISLTQLRGKLTASCTLAYEISTQIIPVTGISLSPVDKSLLIGETVQLTGSVIPGTASNQTILWVSNADGIASVSETGLVIAISAGTAEISAISADGSFTAVCTITVSAITTVTDPEPAETTPGMILPLPQTVAVTLDSGTPFFAPVTWSLDTETADAEILADEGIQYIHFTVSAPLISYALTGDVAYTDLESHYMITLVGIPVVPVTSGVITPDSLSLYLGLDRTRAVLVLDVLPLDADTSALIWASSNPSAVQVESVSPDKKTATIVAVAAGYAVITVSQPGDPAALAFSYVNVAIDPLLTDPAYISATLENDPAPVDQFPDRESIWIRCYDLPDGLYHINIAEKGSTTPLGTGTVEVVCVDPDGDGPARKEFKFQLVMEAYFILTTSFSNSYFVSMSMDPTFPSGDDEVTGLPNTFVDNFKITSPVPTGQLVVNVQELIGGNPTYPSQNMKDMHVILCREIDQPLLDIQYDDYLLSPTQPGSEPLFSDEVKLIGHVQADGSVAWENPREVLKIGGYILLIELPQGFKSNLDEVNPDGDAGELLKEVHILRRTVVYRTVTVWNTQTP